MLPQEIELKILEYLNVKPRKRCRATNRKGNICKKNDKKGYIICEHHKKILEQSHSCNRLQFMELCIMLRRVIEINKWRGWNAWPAQEHYYKWLWSHK